jgi:hypothetical protein
MERTGFSDMAADASAEDSLAGAAVSPLSRLTSSREAPHGSNFEHPRVSNFFTPMQYKVTCPRPSRGVPAWHEYKNDSRAY